MKHCGNGGNDTAKTSRAICQPEKEPAVDCVLDEPSVLAKVTMMYSNRNINQTFQLIAASNTLLCHKLFRRVITRKHFHTRVPIGQSLLSLADLGKQSASAASKYERALSECEFYYFTFVT